MTTKTAAQLLEELRRDPAFIAAEKQREQEIKQRRQALKSEEQQLLLDLKNVGVVVDSVWDLVNTRTSYSIAIPVLIQHLSGPYSAGVREGIVRALTVDYAGSDVLSVLTQEFQTQSDASETSLKWVLGNAIATIAKPSDSDALITLALDASHGKARQMIVFALPRIVRNEAKLAEILHRLEADEDVREFAERAKFSA